MAGPSESAPKQPFGYKIVSRRSHAKREAQRDGQAAFLDLILKVMAGADIQSHAQLNQDMFALALNRFKSGGFFVEFGATDGKNLSNKFVLEKYFGWSGILAEPAAVWHDALRQNRACAIDTRCVWRSSGETLDFSVTQDATLSTISDLRGNDIRANHRAVQLSTGVETVSLTDLLREHNAPKTIDYLSIDTEGSEYEILRAFDFSQYAVSVLTVEHNFGEARGKIHALMERAGFLRILPGLSRIDDWYIAGSLARSFGWS